MIELPRLRLIFKISRPGHIARRYFFTNGYDGALTMLGLLMGFYSSGSIDTIVALNACMGAAIALCISGLASAYISESEERKKELGELESALVTDLTETEHGRATQWVPVLIAAVNGFSPLLIALIIISPFWLDRFDVPLPFPPLPLSLAIAFVTIFTMGLFLGKFSGSHWLWTGLRAVLIAVLTSLIILIVEM